MNQLVLFGQDVYRAFSHLSPVDLTLLAGLLATAFQYLLKQLQHYQNSARIVKFLLSTVFPFVSVLALSLLSSPNLVSAYPWVFFVAQAIYHTLEWVKKNAVKSVETPASFN